MLETIEQKGFAMSQWSAIRPEIDEMVNRQFDTREFMRLFAVPLTARRVEVYQNHMTYYANNRRDCWAMVMGKAPLDVKRAIWEHEKDELIHDERMGRAHVIEADLESSDESQLAPGAKAAFYAWLYCAREKPWLEGLVYSHILERRNNNAIVRGGGLVERWKRKQRAELDAAKAERDFQTEVHAVADEDHSDIFEPIFQRYVVDAASAKAVLDATRDGLLIDRALRGALADAMLEVE
jgi:pyrroloquinoline quinone (PQQ) biosynthesis protein C